ncbi:MAG: HNH endonuclease [Nanoarchaeota archaeon]
MKQCEYCNITENKTQIIFNKKHKKLLCKKHYELIWRYGRLYRTKYDPNIFNIKDDIIEIEIKHKNQLFIAVIDKEDYKRISEFKWHLRKNGYIFTFCKKYKSLSLHRLILGEKENLIIDHINGNKLDNRKCNLRFVTYSQNLMNSKLPNNNTSGYKGVTWDKNRNRWRAQIKINKKEINLGRFIKKEEAIKTRKRAEQKYFGEFAKKD